MEDLIVYSDGRAEYNGKTYKCVLGKGGVKPAADKREGDGATPLGRYPLRQVLYRGDRVKNLKTSLPAREIQLGDRWGEDVDDAASYNKLIQIDNPTEDSGLYREASIFDIIVVIGHNDDPVEVGKGSGIFIHGARQDKGDDFAPTDGCVAFAGDDLRAIVETLTPNTMIEIRK